MTAHAERSVRGRPWCGSIANAVCGNVATPILLAMVLFVAACSDPNQAPTDMVWIPSGEFTMGSDAPDARPDEHPAHRVRMKGFWIDRHEVTNDEFAAFVAATKYVTVAERAVDWELLKQQVPPGTPKPPDEMLQPGSLVFTPTTEAVPTPKPINQGSSSSRTRVSSAWETMA